MSSFFNRESGIRSKIQEVVVPIFVSIVGTIIALFPSNPDNMTLAFTRLRGLPLCGLAASERGYPLSGCLGSQTATDLFCRCSGYRV